IEVLIRPDLKNHLLALSRLIHLKVGYKAHASGRELIELLCSMPNLESICFPDGYSSIWFKGQEYKLGEISLVVELLYGNLASTYGLSI
ncbi:hypothetical protein FRX31_023687, partial [Thalictrum thalictroides]